MKKEGTRRHYPFFVELAYRLNKPYYLLTDSLITNKFYVVTLKY